MMKAVEPMKKIFMKVL